MICNTFVMERRMSGITAGQHPSGARGGGGFGLFLRRWAANPLQIGSVVPSSRALAEHVDPEGAIERDPHVNRSLLLRLIAGVRGL